jgi:hypothetical protein
MAEVIRDGIAGGLRSQSPAADPRAVPTRHYQHQLFIVYVHGAHLCPQISLVYISTRVRERIISNNEIDTGAALLPHRATLLGSLQT